MNVVLDVKITESNIKHLTQDNWIRFGPKFKQFFGDLVKHSVDYTNIPAAALTHYWLRRFSVTLHNALANSFYKHLGRANARAFRDESRDAGVIIEQSYTGPASVSNSSSTWC
jgi:hypothetical protein